VGQYVAAQQGLHKEIPQRRQQKEGQQVKQVQAQLKGI
jgi:hypothetical protein